MDRRFERVGEVWARLQIYSETRSKKAHFSYKEAEIVVSFVLDFALFLRDMRSSYSTVLRCMLFRTSRARCEVLGTDTQYSATWGGRVARN
eukprot:3937208-Rhodomonas_salina.8